MNFSILKSDKYMIPVVPPNTGFLSCNNFRILPESQAGMVKTYGDELF